MPKKHLLLLHILHQSIYLIVWITTNWKILKELGLSNHLTCLLWNQYAGQEVTVRTRHGTIDWFKIGKGVHQGYIIYCYSTYLTICRVHHAKCRAGCITSWDQDCQEKQPQICRWYHSDGRKQRGTKESLDGGEKREWKSWLKTQYSKN